MLSVDSRNNLLISGWGRVNSERITTTVKYDADGHLKWAVYSPWDNRYPIGKFLAVDPVDNVYVSGSVESGRPFDQDFAAIKYGPDGELRWFVTYDGPETIRLLPGGLTRSDDALIALAVDASGNVYLTGYTLVAGREGVGFMTVKYVQHPPAFVTGAQNQSVPSGSNVTFVATASGGIPLSYQWEFKGTNINGERFYPVYRKLRPVVTSQPQLIAAGTVLDCRVIILSERPTIRSASDIRVPGLIDNDGDGLVGPVARPVVILDPPFLAIRIVLHGRKVGRSVVERVRIAGDKDVACLVGCDGDRNGRAIGRAIEK